MKRKRTYYGLVSHSVHGMPLTPNNVYISFSPPSVRKYCIDFADQHYDTIHLFKANRERAIYNISAHITSIDDFIKYIKKEFKETPNYGT